MEYNNEIKSREEKRNKLKESCSDLEERIAIQKELLEEQIKEINILNFELQNWDKQK